MMLWAEGLVGSETFEAWVLDLAFEDFPCKRSLHERHRRRDISVGPAVDQGLRLGLSAQVSKATAGSSTKVPMCKSTAQVYKQKPTSLASLEST